MTKTKLHSPRDRYGKSGKVSDFNTSLGPQLDVESELINTLNSKINLVKSYIENTNTDESIDLTIKIPVIRETILGTTHKDVTLDHWNKMLNNLRMTIEKLRCEINSFRFNIGEVIKFDYSSVLEALVRHLGNLLAIKLYHYSGEQWKYVPL